MAEHDARPAGWYADEHDNGLQRWWDGSQWTGATRPKSDAEVLADAKTAFNAKVGTASKDSQFFKGCLWFVIGAFLLAFVGCMALMTSGDSDSSDEFGEGEARYVCEQFVSDRLKSPGTAEFQRPTGRAAGVEEWTMTGTVDAENSFGGTVRMSYVCTVRAAGDGDATLIDLDLVER